MVVLCPFEYYGMDIVSLRDPLFSMGHNFILIVMKYFFKWIEVIPLREAKASYVHQIFKNHIKYSFNVLWCIIYEVYTTFKSMMNNKFSQWNDINWLWSTLYYPQARNLVNAFNKTYVSILKKTLYENKRLLSLGLLHCQELSPKCIGLRPSIL